MVVGRRRFTWRDDVRGVVSVVMLGLISFAGAAVLMLAVHLLSTR